MFTKEAIDRFRNPKNVGILKNANGIGTAGDPNCSDVVELMIRFKDDTVKDAKFKVYGCPGAVSTTDVFVDLIKGKKIDEIFKITDENLAEELGGLPVTFLHCSNLSIDAFKKAVEDYKK